MRAAAVRALVELDGDAAVMHIGRKPYLVAPAGAIEIGECGLTAAAVETLIVEILPDSARDVLVSRARPTPTAS